MAAHETVAEVLLLESDPGFCRVRVGRRWHGPLRRERAEALGLRPGAAWSERTAKAVAAAVAEAAARRMALALLGVGARSRAGLMRRLVARGASAAVAEAVVEELRQDGWLDDARSAAERAEAMVRRGRRSAEVIGAALEREGFEPALARAAAEAAAPAMDPAAARRRALALRRQGAPPARIARQLLREGADSDTIRDVLESFEP